MLKPMNFDGLNETDIREEVITPLLRGLGYRTGTENDIIRETSLSYPQIFIGRKKPNRDPALRGKPDYILNVQERVCWVIEAKGPNVPIDLEGIEQAFSYANHSEVRALYFCICNGRELSIFQTNQGPSAPALKTFTFAELVESTSTIENILGPDAILRDHPKIEPDSGKPLGPGLRSEAKLINGKIVFQSNSMNKPQLIGYTVTISDGVVRRNEKGQLAVYLETTSPFDGMQKFNEKFGYDKFEVFSDDSIVSADKDKPTIFRSTKHIVLPANEKFFDPFKGIDMMFPVIINCHTETLAIGALSGKKFEGEFEAKYHYPELDNLHLSMKGDFLAQLA